MKNATFAAIFALSTIAATTASPAAFDFTYNGKTTVVCTWTEAASRMYKDAQTQSVDGNAKIVKLGADHPANDECKKAQRARKAAKAAAKAAKEAAKSSDTAE